VNTLLLDRDSWDLCLDTSGNIALASDPYSIAQDVASALRLFLGELWYAKSLGVPYFSDILGKRPPSQLMKAEFTKAALRVPETVSAICYLSSLTKRDLHGQVQVKATSGKTIIVQVQPNNFVFGVSLLDGNDVL
jgi:hypothetical protein